MKNLFGVAVIALLLVGAGCRPAPATITPEARDEPSSPPVDTPHESDEGKELVPLIPSEETSKTPSTTTKAETPPAETVKTEPPAPAPATLEISMESGSFFFKPSSFTAKPGQKVHVSFTGELGGHTFAIDALGLSERLTAMGITFTAPTTPGSYEYYCDIGSHRSLGMKGTMIVK